MSATEGDLVWRARQGDRGAFEEIVRLTSRLLYARLYLETGDPHQAEDLVQETYLRAYRGIDSLDRPGNLRSWLLNIARNAAIDAARGRARTKRAEPKTNAGRPVERAAPDPSPAESAESAEQRRRALEVLRSLPEEYRLPLSLRYLAGADYATIERQLGLTNGALRGLLHRGLALMRERMTTEPEG